MTASLDRCERFSNSDERDHRRKSLIEKFKQVVAGLNHPMTSDNDDEWEMLGRHHGLPTTLLDWTFSPYIAAYFAFADQSPETAEFVAIWMLDRANFAGALGREIELFDDYRLLRSNPRARDQCALFLQKKRHDPPTEKLLSPALMRFDIPVNQRQEALGYLDETNVYARILFQDLEGAAKTAACRVLVLGDR
ncbi:MAG: FRG domain-containing protein [Candidatus Saccharimonas sp.]|nr:FRG domain-containing protein [Planctomycetaceae bacterium]